MSLDDFIAVDNATILKDAQKITEQTLGGAATKSLVMLDIEYPVSAGRQSTVQVVAAASTRAV